MTIAEIIETLARCDIHQLHPTPSYGKPPNKKQTRALCDYFAALNGGSPCPWNSFVTSWSYLKMHLEFPEPNTDFWLERLGGRAIVGY
jgi:hypothetical protein